jgi:predicted anti-sigma-YlaC factor YlaD
MKCDEMKILLSGLIDGELNPGQKKTAEDHIVSCPECRAEHARLKKLKEVTDDMKYFDLPDRLWAGYWHNIYRRIERGVGWILISIGSISVLAFAAWRFLNDFFLDQDISIVLRFGIGAATLGLIILLISIIKERLFSRKHDRYDEVDI